MRMLFVLGFLAARAWACSCAVSPTGTPPCQSAWQHHAVFTGTVLEITDPGPPVVPIGQPVVPIGQIDTTGRATARNTTAVSPLPFRQRKVRIKITEPLAGLDPNQQEIVIDTGFGGGDCGYGFRRGFDYIVYASKGPDGSLSTGICSPTRLVESAAEDLKYFHQLAQASPVAEIRVTAFDVHGTRESGGGNPRLPVLAGARVTVDGPGVHQLATTDAAGRHIFAGLPPGAYKVDASLEGFVAMGPIRPVQVHSKGCAEVPLWLQLDRTVTGRILTKDGLPAAGVTVEAVRTRPRFENELPEAADSSKDG